MYNVQGYNKEEKTLDFEREGEYYRDIMSLLREKSAKFNELVDKLVSDYKTIEVIIKIYNTVKMFSLYTSILDLQVNFELHDAKDGQDNLALDIVNEQEQNEKKTTKSQDDSGNSEDKRKSDKKKKEGGEKKKKFQPSAKWQNIEMEKDEEE